MRRSASQRRRTAAGSLTVRTALFPSAVHWPFHGALRSSTARAVSSTRSTCWVIQAWRSMARARWGSGDGGAAPLAAWGDAVRGTAAVASALVEVAHAGCVGPRVDGRVQAVEPAGFALEAGDVAVGELLGAVHGVVSVSGAGGSLVLSKKLPISSP